MTTVGNNLLVPGGFMAGEEIPYGTRLRSDDVVWRNFDEECTDITDEMVEKIIKNKGKFKYRQTDGLFNRVMAEKKEEKK